jgi:hypothetical protein
MQHTVNHIAYQTTIRKKEVRERYKHPPKESSKQNPHLVSIRRRHISLSHHLRRVMCVFPLAADDGTHLNLFDPVMLHDLFDWPSFFRIRFQHFSNQTSTLSGIQVVYS